MEKAYFLGASHFGLHYLVSRKKRHCVSDVDVHWGFKVMYWQDIVGVIKAPFDLEVCDSAKITKCNKSKLRSADS